MIRYPNIKQSKPPELAINKFNGINQSLDNVLTGLEYASSAQNCDISSGVLKRCKGATVYNTAKLATNITSLMAHFKGGTGSILAVSEGNIYKLTGSSWDNAILSGLQSSDIRYINYQKDMDEILIFTNGVDPIKAYDGSTFRNLKNRAAIHNPDGSILNWLDGDGSTHSSEAECTSLAPVFKYITLYKERVWGADNKGIYFSKDMDPDDWTAPSDEIEVNQHGGYIDLPTWDGGQIIGLRNLWDDLLIFKTKTVHRIFGTYPGNFELIQVFSEMNGHILDKTISAGRNVAFWATSSGVFMYLGGTGDADLTPAIQQEFSKVNKAAIDNSVGIVFKDKYILAMPEGSSTVPNMIFEYDINKKTFMVKRGMNISTFLELGERLIYADGDGILYEYNIGDTYGDQPIASSYTTGTVFLANKVFSFDAVNFIGKGDGQVKISVITEERTESIVVSLSDQEKVIQRDLMNEGRRIAFKFENVNGSYFEIKQPQFVGTIDID